MSEAHIGVTGPQDLPDAWTKDQVLQYGRVFRFMLTNQVFLTHPGSIVMPEDHWLTVCHNAAWLSAEVMDGQDFSLMDEDSKVIASTEFSSRLH